MEYSTTIKGLYLVLASIHIPVSLVLIYVLQTTKHMPFASKYLATGLLTFDIGLIACTTFYKFVSDSLLYTQAINIYSQLLQLIFTTTALMSLERMLVLAFPMRYLRLGSEKRIRFIINVVWLTVVVLFCILNFLVCWVIYQDMTIFYKPEICRQIRLNYYLLLVATVQVVSLASYSVVFRIVKKQTSRDNINLSMTSLRKLVHMYKSTFMVMKYIIVMTLTSIGYVSAVVLVRNSMLTTEESLLAADIVSVFNCFLDPFLYVFWNAECREVCKQLMSRFMCRNKVSTEKTSYRTGYPRGIVTIDKLTTTIPNNATSAMWLLFTFYYTAIF